jgi:hypothetical protein
MRQNMNEWDLRVIVVYRGGDVTLSQPFIVRVCPCLWLLFDVERPNVSLVHGSIHRAFNSRTPCCWNSYGYQYGKPFPTQTPIMFEILNTCTVLYRGGTRNGVG